MAPPRHRLIFVSDSLTGPADLLFEKMLNSIGLSRQDLHMIDVSSVSALGDDTDIAKGIARDIAGAELIVALGQVATRTLLQTDEDFSTVRGKLRACGTTPLISTFHPRILIENPTSKRKAWADLQLIASTLGLTLNQKGK